MAKHNATGRSKHSPSRNDDGLGPVAAARLFKLSGPPQDASWTWLSREMLESEAWAALPLAARRVIDILLIEHMANSGKRNGELVVTYAQFAAAGVRRASLAKAIEAARRLGFVDTTRKGRLNVGPKTEPSSYGLTWLPRCDLTPASNRWRHITKEQAEAIVTAAPSAPLPGDIERGSENASGNNGGFPPVPGAKTRPAPRRENASGDSRISAISQTRKRA